MNHQYQTANEVYRLKDLPLGSIVYLNLSLTEPDYGKRMFNFRIVAKNHPGYPKNSVTLWAIDSAISLPYDTPETERPNLPVGRGYYFWPESNIRQLLHGPYAAFSINNNTSNYRLTPYRYDVFPEQIQFPGGKNRRTYKNRQGEFITFYFPITAYFIWADNITRHDHIPLPTTIRSRTAEGNIVETTDLFFLPSAVELGLITDRYSPSQTFDLYRGGANNDTTHMLSREERMSLYDYSYGDSIWLRGDYANAGLDKVRTATRSGSRYVLSDQPATAFHRIRPCINLSGDVMVIYNSARSSYAQYSTFPESRNVNALLGSERRSQLSAVRDSDNNSKIELTCGIHSSGASLTSPVMNTRALDAIRINGTILAQYKETSTNEYVSIHEIDDENGRVGVLFAANVNVPTLASHKPLNISTIKAGIETRKILVAFDKNQRKKIANILSEARPLTKNINTANIAPEKSTLSIKTIGENIQTASDDIGYGISPLLNEDFLPFNHPTAVFGSNMVKKLWNTSAVISDNRIFDSNTGKCIGEIPVPIHELVQTYTFPNNDRIVYVHRRRNNTQGAKIERYEIARLANTGTVVLLRASIAIPDNVQRLTLYPSYNGYCTLVFCTPDANRWKFIMWNTSDPSSDVLFNSPVQTNMSTSDPLAMWYHHILGGHICQYLETDYGVNTIEPNMLLFYKYNKNNPQPCNLTTESLVGYSQWLNYGNYKVVAPWTLNPPFIWIDTRENKLFTIGEKEKTTGTSPLNVYSTPIDSIGGGQYTPRYSTVTKEEPIDSDAPRMLTSGNMSESWTSFSDQHRSLIASSSLYSAPHSTPTSSTPYSTLYWISGYGLHQFTFRWKNVNVPTKLRLLTPLNRVPYGYGMWQIDSMIGGDRDSGKGALLAKQVCGFNDDNIMPAANANTVCFFAQNDDSRITNRRLKLYDQVCWINISSHVFSNSERGTMEHRNTENHSTYYTHAIWANTAVNDSTAVDSFRIYNMYITNRCTCTVTIVPGTEVGCADELDKIEFLDDVIEHNGFVEVFFKRKAGKSAPNMKHIFACLKFDIDVEYFN